MFVYCSLWPTHWSPSPSLVWGLWATSWAWWFCPDPIWKVGWRKRIIFWSSECVRTITIIQLLFHLKLFHQAQNYGRKIFGNFSNFQMGNNIKHLYQFTFLLKNSKNYNFSLAPAPGHGKGEGTVCEMKCWGEIKSGVWTMDCRR